MRFQAATTTAGPAIVISPYSGRARTSAVPDADGLSAVHLADAERQVGSLEGRIREQRLLVDAAEARAPALRSGREGEQRALARNCAARSFNTKIN